jgi:hypothetical protein
MAAMGPFSRKRRIGTAAAFAAAYALVLNVILSSVLLASLSPTAFAAAHEICINGGDAAAAQDDAGKTGKSATVRCPLCVGNHASGALPPAVPALVSRVAVAVSPQPVFDAAFVACDPAHDHQPRGPPQLI